MDRRQFLQLLGVLGLVPKHLPAFSQFPSNIYNTANFGNVTLMHFTDCHAQLLPVYYREPKVNIGIRRQQVVPPHIAGKEFLKFFNIRVNSRAAHAFTYLDFTHAARQYGKMGGFAYLSTLINQLREARGFENSLLLDGGDSWQGSATSLWTRGQDMVSACNLLGVDVMTGHWEFTYGLRQVLDNLEKFNGEFVAQNIGLTEEAMFMRDIEAAKVFKPYVIKQLKNVRVAIIGQAFPYTPIANPRRFVADLQFGIQERELQQTINKIRQGKEADVIVLLSHNGMDVDLKLASQVSGIDAIMGGHTHDAIPKPVLVSNPGGRTIVTNAGSHGKFLGVLDLQVKSGRLLDFRYQLLPVFSKLLPANGPMQNLIKTIRQPFLVRLQKPLAVTEDLLFRRDNFIGSFDQLILNALREVNNAQISFSPGFRWGTSLLPKQTITVEDVMNHTAITYPETYVQTMDGKQIKRILEDVCDNLFNKDPYLQQGGDMVRVGGLRYSCNPYAEIGNRIFDLRLENGELLAANKQYKVSGWASVARSSAGIPIWEVVEKYLQERDSVSLELNNYPKIINPSSPS